ncbi:Hypothetical protein NocV09_02100720 [Nannochloropsis oceanica]
MSPSTETAKATRPDVAERKELQETLEMQCVKCCLSKRLAPGWHPTVKTVLLETLERQIRSTSEIVVRGSLLVNEVLQYVSRDGNGARNILRVYRSMVRGEARPHDLRFGQPRQDMRTLYV